MPFKSQAQRGKFYAMADKGDMPKKTVKEYENATLKGKKLPMYAGKESKLKAMKRKAGM